MYKAHKQSKITSNTLHIKLVTIWHFVFNAFKVTELKSEKRACCVTREPNEKVLCGMCEDTEEIKTFFFTRCLLPSRFQLHSVRQERTFPQSENTNQPRSHTTTRVASCSLAQVHTSMGTMASLEPMGGRRFCSLRK